MTPPPPLPLSFRQELAPHLFKAVAGGWSCAVVGLPGLGLSNLLRFLVEPRVAEHYLGADADAGQSLMVFVEGDRLLDPAALFAGLARQVLAAAHAQQWPRAEQAALRRLADTPSSGALADPAAPLAGLVQHVCGDLERRLVFVCDEFDAALLSLPSAALRELRALRDAHKYRLAFIAGLRHDAARIAAARTGDDLGGGAAKLAELFDQHTYPLRPYLPADCRLAIARKTLGWATAPSEEQQAQLCRLTGGHAKLLIASLIYLEPRLHLPWANVERGLLADAGLAEISRALWQALAPGDQRALWLLARDERDAMADGGLERLALLGLAAGGPAFVFSSLFEAIVLAQPEPPAPAEPGPVSHLRDPEATVNW
jgi:hypothetical protein